MRIHLETQAKLHIQDMIRRKQIEYVEKIKLVTPGEFTRRMEADG